MFQVFDHINSNLLGIVVTTSPTWSLCSKPKALKNIIKTQEVGRDAKHTKQMEDSYLYKIVVLPAPSNPNIRIRNSFWPKSDEKRLEKKPPVVY